MQSLSGEYRRCTDRRMTWPEWQAARMIISSEISDHDNEKLRLQSEQFIDFLATIYTPIVPIRTVKSMINSLDKKKHEKKTIYTN